MKYRAFISLWFFVGMVAGSISSANAQERPCVFREGGFGYVRVQEGNEIWKYSLRMSGPDWRSEGYGWHASGLFVSGSDPSQQDYSEGLFYLFAASKAANVKTVKQRVLRSKEFLNYPPIVLSKSEIEYSESKESVDIGNLSGYAILYRVTKFVEKDLSNHRLLVLYLTDGCVIFETTILLAAVDKDDCWMRVKLLLEQATIERIPSVLSFR